MAQFKYRPIKNASIPQIEDTSAAIHEFTPTNVLDVVLGIDKNNEVVFTNIAKLPHLLIGGSTGSGKSNFLHALISCLLKYKPEELGLVLIDTKRVELSCYENIPNLINKINYTALDASRSLIDMHEECRRRFKIFEKENVKNIQEYNSVKSHKLNYIVIIIDEIADLIYEDEEIKSEIVRVAQISRAAGIHFVIATQRPSADVVDGKIKANFPARLAFKCAAVQDSMIVLGAPGAEKLQRPGDFLYEEAGVKEHVEARAVWIKSTHTRTTPAKSSVSANENIQQALSQVSDVNVDDFSEKYANTKLMKADVKAALSYIIKNKITKINRNDFENVIIHGQVRDKLLELLTRENVIDSSGAVNASAVSRIIKTKL